MNWMSLLLLIISSTAASAAAPQAREEWNRQSQELWDEIQQANRGSEASTAAPPPTGRDTGPLYQAIGRALGYALFLAAIIWFAIRQKRSAERKRRPTHDGRRQLDE